MSRRHALRMAPVGAGLSGSTARGSRPSETLAEASMLHPDTVRECRSQVRSGLVHNKGIHRERDPRSGNACAAIWACAWRSREHAEYIRRTQQRIEMFDEVNAPLLIEIDRAHNHHINNDDDDNDVSMKLSHHRWLLRQLETAVAHQPCRAKTESPKKKTASSRSPF